METNCRGRVLIVDDESDVRMSLHGIIENSGFEAYAFENGNDALTFLLEQHADVDVILTDIRMPGMDGLALLEKVLATNAEIPVILMTGFADIDLTVAAINKGAFDFILKPIDPEYMIKAIEKASNYRRLCLLEKNYRDVLEKALVEQDRKLKEINEIVLQNEKMSLMGQIAAGVAHEINSPVGFISSNLESLDKYMRRLLDFVRAQSELLDRYCPPEELEQIREVRKKVLLDKIADDIPKLLEDTLEGVVRIKGIVKNLKGFSRSDSDEFVLTNINEVISKSLDMVRNELKYVATVATDYGDIPPTQCLPNQLAQVLMNLLINAAHAMVDQGEIIVRSWREGENIYFSIRDTGCGIPEDIKDHIFEPFFTTKEVGKGTGLGLSICFDIIRKHNGDISMESALGKGTIFTIRLPIVL